MGFPFHLLRPTGSKTFASGGESSGPVSFLHMYNAAFGIIKQQQRHGTSCSRFFVYVSDVQTGANMSILAVSHPDVLEFIHCKEREARRIADVSHEKKN